ncbi:GtrA family protein [Profundibacterium mesophilum]|uniref:GtrA-like protein domain containing protein n=1 Tax=Profundibacterium mesophilum KAUST100406-0324 TaxID=1037889 RepID=A0A921TFU5_9RHOB|nr:GtrA family protein [Profundibacterium mesophilum]KAF0676784.1 GtrA-like protein domain containing protein [Profundibacterium mesophilum KAUST100406-0324]
MIERRVGADGAGRTPGRIGRRMLALRYAGFALAAAAINLGTQRAVLAQADGWAIFALALGLGTIAGLVVKYGLDRRWIFGARPLGPLAEGHRFGLYSATGGLTTALFWASETLFWVIWQTDGMRELGAALGLGGGYWLKYHLDRRFVFAQPAWAAS